MVEDSRESSREGTSVARDCLAGAELSPKTEAVMSHKCVCFVTFLFNHSFGRKYQKYLQTKGGWFVCVGVGRRHKSTWIGSKIMDERSSSRVYNWNYLPVCLQCVCDCKCTS